MGLVGWMGVSKMGLVFDAISRWGFIYSGGRVEGFG